MRVVVVAHIDKKSTNTVVEAPEYAACSIYPLPMSTHQKYVPPGARVVADSVVAVPAVIVLLPVPERVITFM